VLECPQPVPLLFRVPTTPTPSRERQSGRGALIMKDDSGSDLLDLMYLVISVAVVIGVVYVVFFGFP
jgi:hypothetical protein